MNRIHSHVVQKKTTNGFTVEVQLTDKKGNLPIEVLKKAVITAYVAGDDVSILHHALTLEKEIGSQSMVIAYNCNEVYDFIIMNVYSTFNNGDEGAWKELQHMIGSSLVPLSDIISGELVIVDFFSEAKNVQGQIKIKLVKQNSNNPIKYTSKTDLDIKKKKAKESVYAFEKLHKSNLKGKQFNIAFSSNPPQFTSISYRGDRLPIPVILSSLRNIKMQKEHFEQTMLHWLKIAKANCGYKLSITRLHPPSDAYTLGEIIAEMFTMPFKGFVYSHDRNFMRRSLFDEDQWMSILSFPDLPNASFDCEDSAITTLEIINAFRDATFTDQELLFIQQKLLPRYATCVILGLLKVSDDASKPESWVYHAYPIFLDKNLFVDGSKGPLMPSVLLECTSYTASTFSEEACVDEAKGYQFDKGDMLFDEAKDTSCSPPQKGKTFSVQAGLEAHLRFVLHLKAPVSRVCSSLVYGQIHTIFTCESNDCKDGIQLCVYNPYDKDGIIGIEALTLFKMKQEFTMKLTMKVTDLDIANMTPLLHCNTPVTLPTTLTCQNTTIPIYDGKGLRYIMKDIDSTFLQVALKELDDFGEQKAKHTRLNLFDGCPMYIVDVSLPL